MLLIFVALKTYSFLLFNCSIAVPSSPPSAFSLAAKTSTSITASWQLPPPCTRNGEITGFKLFYNKKDSRESAAMVKIDSGATLTQNITGLDMYTEYKFQLLAFTSVGDGTNSSAKVTRTLPDGKRSEIMSCVHLIVVFKSLCPRMFEMGVGWGLALRFRFSFQIMYATFDLITIILPGKFGICQQRQK